MTIKCNLGFSIYIFFICGTCTACILPTLLFLYVFQLLNASTCQKYVDMFSYLSDYHAQMAVTLNEKLYAMHSMTYDARLESNSTTELTQLN